MPSTDTAGLIRRMLTVVRAGAEANEKEEARAIHGDRLHHRSANDVATRGARVIELRQLEREAMQWLEANA